MTRGHYGRLPKTEDTRDYAARVVDRYTGPYVDLSSQFPQPPYDQLTLGSCVSNAVAAACDFARVKEGLPPLDCPSRLFVYYNGRILGGEPIDEDSGLEVRDGLKSLGKDGAPPESEWPYDIDKFADKPTAQAYNDGADDIATLYGAVAKASVDAVVASGYPVVIGFDVYESFESDAVAQTGVMPIPAKSEQQLGGHCVLIVSTQIDGAQIPGAVAGRKYYLCRNSWGTDWGSPAAPGHFYMPAAIVTGSESSDFWQLTTVGSSVTPIPPGPTPTPFDRVIGMLRSVWADLDSWLKAHNL